MGPRAAVAMGTTIVAATALIACTREPNYIDRGVIVNSPRACPIAKSEAFAVIYGSGDYDSTAKPAVASVFLREDDAVLADIPDTTRALLVDVSRLATADAWRGVAEVPKSGLVNVLVWPNDAKCELTRNVESRNDPTQRDVSLAVFGRHFMVFGGLQAAGGTTPHTYIGDLSTGIVEQTDNSALTPRGFATVTAFGGGPGDDPVPALVAGGQDPESEDLQNPFVSAPSKSLDVSETAEIFVPDTTSGAIGRFTRDTIRLSVPRAQHGATVLSNGNTFLVGGRGPGGGVLGQVEVIDRVRLESNRDGLRSLRVPRANPDVLRLANGDVLVYGGVDDGGHALGSFEWFDALGKPLARQSLDLPAGREHGIVPLPAGGALVVIAPVDASIADFKTVWVVSADGSSEAALPIDPRDLQVVRLFTGARGAPVLWTGAPPLGAGWLRWDPWFGAFQTIPDAPNEGPQSAAIANGDSGLALWLDDRGDATGMRVIGFRFDAQTKYAEVPPLLVTDPVGLSPDRLANKAGGAITFDPISGLVVGPGASAFVDDVTFADFAADLEISQAAPEIVLRQENGTELSVGGRECAFGQNAQKTLHVERKKTVVSVRADDGDTRQCPTFLDDGVRVGIGIRGASGANVSGGRNLRITRR